MKRILSAVLAVMLLLSMTPCTVAAAGRDVSFEETLAADLKELGLFKGVSETNFNLGRAPSRIEALVMLVRVLGKEQEALGGTWEHPFTDVPKWANQYVGYAYENKLTNGISATEYGTGDADARTYLTFVLRALGYSDKDGEDFTWNSPYALASEVGILADCVDLEEFWRADVVIISYAALPVRLKDSDQTLAEKLIDAGAFTKEQFDANFDPDFLKNAPKDASTEEKPTEEKPSQSETTTTGEKLSAQEISEKCSGAVFSITCYAFNGAVKGTGSGFFVSSDGLAVTNYHVITNCSTISITLADGTVYEDVDMIDGYSDIDLALLRVDGSNFPYLELSDSAALKQGQRVYAIGSPLGLDNTMSEGIVSNAKRVIDGAEYIQISVPIAPGSSGGALLDEYGRVVGVTTAGYADSTGDLNLAVGSNWIAELDRGETGSYVFFSEEYYPYFYLAYDFGAFAWVDMVDYTMTPLGYICVYDAEDFHDNFLREASDNYAYTMYYYHEALLLNGFVNEDGDDSYGGQYISDTERVYYAADLEEDFVIYVMVERVPQYYKECPKLPDLAWYLEVDAQEAEKIDNSWTWLYDWEPYYYEEDFLTMIGLYFDLLEEDGFAQVYGEDGTYLFEGHGWSIAVVYDDEQVFVDAKPLN